MLAPMVLVQFRARLMRANTTSGLRDGNCTSVFFEGFHVTGTTARIVRWHAPLSDERGETIRCRAMSDKRRGYLTVTKSLLLLLLSSASR